MRRLAKLLILILVVVPPAYLLKVIAENALPELSGALKWLTAASSIIIVVSALFIMFVIVGYCFETSEKHQFKNYSNPKRKRPLLELISNQRDAETIASLLNSSANLIPDLSDAEIQRIKLAIKNKLILTVGEDLERDELILVYLAKNGAFVKTPDVISIDECSGLITLRLARALVKL